MKRKIQNERSDELLRKINELKIRGVSYSEAMLEIHDLMGIDLEDMVEMLPDNIIKKVKLELINKNNRINRDKLSKRDRKFIEKSTNSFDILSFFD